MANRLELSAAVQILTGEKPLLPGERVAVDKIICRVAVQSLAAKVTLPGYNQSTRDGFVVAAGGDATESGRSFRNIGEIPAGGKENITMPEGTSCRIMTGGMVPTGGLRVVPQEDCEPEGDMVTIPAHALERQNTYIQNKGSKIAENDLIVAAGTITSGRAFGASGDNRPCGNRGVQKTPCRVFLHRQRTCRFHRST